MPKPLIVSLKFEDVPPPSGPIARNGSIAAQVKDMPVGKSVLLAEKAHVFSFVRAVKKQRPECKVVKANEVGGTRCWLMEDKPESESVYETTIPATA